MDLSKLLSRLPLLGRTGVVPLPRTRELRPRAEPTRTFHGFEGLPEATGERPLGDGCTLRVHHPEALPPKGPGLTVMTYNILLGGKRREALGRYFDELEQTGRMPDVIGLQEANQSIAVHLARRHGFHLAYFGCSGRDGQRLVNGKAVLSRHPLREATYFTYAVAEPEREAAITRYEEAGELVEDRGVLCATLDVGGRSVCIYNVHHTLGDPGINANDLVQLNWLLRQRGGPAVVLGDFNTNTLITRDGTWLGAQLRRYDPTHTVEEYQARYGNIIASVGDAGVGNAADPRIRRQLRKLKRRWPEALGRARRTAVRKPDGTVLTPREARAELNSGRVDKGSEPWRRLQDVADGATLNPLPDDAGHIPATGKRFDTIYSSRRLVPKQVEIDRSTDASDHVPVLARFHWR